MGIGKIKINKIYYIYYSFDILFLKKKIQLEHI